VIDPPTIAGSYESTRTARRCSCLISHILFSPSSLDGSPSLLAAALDVEFSLFSSLLGRFGNRLEASCTA